MTETPPQRDYAQRNARALNGLFWCFIMFVLFILWANFLARPRTLVMTQLKDNQQTLMQIRDSISALANTKDESSENITKKLDLIENSTNLEAAPDTE